MTEPSPASAHSPAPAPRKKWDFTEPQTALAAVGIVATLITGAFGLAFAFPTGQDLLCRHVGVSCRRVEITEIRLSAWAVEYDNWCNQRDAADAATTPYDALAIRPEGAVCVLDATYENPRGFSGPMAYVERTPGIAIIGHLTFSYPRINAPVDFTIEPACWRSLPDEDYMSPLPCQLAPPRIGAEIAYPSLDQSDRMAMRPENAASPDMIRARLHVEDKGVFVGRYRLEFDGQGFANLPPGRYRMDLGIGAPGEPIEPSDPTLARLEFDVIEPPPADSTNPSLHDMITTPPPQ